MKHSYSKSRRIRISAGQVTFATSALIVSVIVGLVLLSWVTQNSSPPLLALSRADVREAQGQYYLPFSVTNTGGSTAASVQVVGVAREGAIEESGEQMIDFLSSGETKEGAFVFNQNPRTAEVTLRIASYSLP